jgi:hypothetical protein
MTKTSVHRSCKNLAVLKDRMRQNEEEAKKIKSGTRLTLMGGIPFLSSLSLL